MGPYYKKKPFGLTFNLMDLLIPAHPCSKSLSFSIFWSTVPSQLPTMKQQCLRIGDEDKISKLPEALLVQILSLLPTEQVIATSAVSKYWKSLWKMVPNLKFISYYHKSKYHTFSEIVTTCLLSHQAPVLENLHLVARDTSDASDIDMWIGIAFARRVRNLVLDLHYVERKLIRFPNVLCSLNNTLETLELRYSILLHLPTPVCLKSLRKLHLHFVEFEDQDSVCNFLCGCPCLEDLVVYRKRNMDVPTFTIAVPSLQRLTIEDNFPGKSDGGYVINAPSLQFLSIQGFADLKFCLIENAPKLVEAKIIDVSDITNENILASLTSVKRLSLYVSPLQIKYPTESMFYQLVYLELRNSWNQPWWNLLALMLDRSPKLQILKLIDPRPYLCTKRYHMVDLKWKQPKCVPECLLFHLETFVWTRYEWQREEEKEVATYILKNARRLKKATFSTEHLESNEHKKLRKKSEMLNELASVVRASNSCHLVFES